MWEERAWPFKRESIMGSLWHSWSTSTSGLEVHAYKPVSVQALCWLRPCWLPHSPPTPFHLLVVPDRMLLAYCYYMEAFGWEILSIYLCDLGNVCRAEGVSRDSLVPLTTYMLQLENILFRQLQQHILQRPPHSPRNLGAYLAMSWEKLDHVNRESYSKKCTE